MGMQIILQSLVLVSKIAQFKTYAAGLLIKLISKCKLKKYFFGNKTTEKPANFATRGLLLIAL